MKIYGIVITQEQQDAAMAAMTGEFFAVDVQKALENANVPHTVQSGINLHTYYISSMVADRLLRAARKRGFIFYDAPRWISRSTLKAC